MESSGPVIWVQKTASGDPLGLGGWGSCGNVYLLQAEFEYAKEVEY